MYCSWIASFAIWIFLIFERRKRENNPIETLFSSKWIGIWPIIIHTKPKTFGRTLTHKSPIHTKSHWLCASLRKETNSSFLIHSNPFENILRSKFRSIEFICYVRFMYNFVYCLFFYSTIFRKPSWLQFQSSFLLTNSNIANDSDRNWRE